MQFTFPEILEVEENLVWQEIQDKFKYFPPFHRNMFSLTDYNIAIG